MRNDTPLPRPPPSPPLVPAWLDEVGDLPDHYHGQVWSGGVMPNNHLFFLRTRPHQLAPLGVTHNLHHRYELVINYEGAGTLCVDRETYRFEPGSAILVKPGVFHYYFGVPPEGFNWLFFTFELNPGADPAPSPEGAVRLETMDWERVEKAACTYLNPRSELDVFETGLGMGRLLHDLGSRPPLPPASRPEDKEIHFCTLLRNVTLFVDAHMDRALRIRDLADHVDMSESHLRKVFREEGGASLGGYLRRSRLARGVQLIHHGDLSISEVAKQSGFESIHAFSQSFRRAIGMPPTAYRKHLEDGNAPIRIPLDSGIPATMEGAE